MDRARAEQVPRSATAGWLWPRQPERDVFGKGGLGQLDAVAQGGICHRRDIAFGDPPSRSEFRAALNVPERTLNAAFQDGSRMAPKAYLRALRLSAARRRLRGGP